MDLGCDMKFKKCEINGCQCMDCGCYRIVKQKNKEIYNAYKACEPKPGKPVSTYSSIMKEIIRVEKYIDDNGEEKEANVMGAREYLTLEAAILDCENDCRQQVSE